MELTHAVLNLVVPPFLLANLVLLYPLLLLWRLASTLYRLPYPEDVRGKVVLITGASSGIGEETAYRYAERGAKLVLSARREDRLRHVAQECKRKGAMEALVYRADLREEENNKQLVDYVIHKFGRLDHCFANVGVAMAFHFEDAPTTKAFREEIASTFWSDVYTIYYALPHLRQRKGVLLVMASAAAFTPYPYMTSYNAAKAAIANLADTIRVEEAGEVHVTVIEPGWVESEMTMGKFINEEGNIVWDKNKRDVSNLQPLPLWPHLWRFHVALRPLSLSAAVPNNMLVSCSEQCVVGPVPVERTKTCSETIIDAALRRKMHRITPKWFAVMLYYRTFGLKILEPYLRTMFCAPKGQKPFSKMLVELPLLQQILYPKTLRQ
eukprot:SM000056S18002  [mRNA]  locus=s56:730278:732182:+ [translate_table: standard]